MYFPKLGNPESLFPESYIFQNNIFPETATTVQGSTMFLNKKPLFSSFLYGNGHSHLATGAVVGRSSCLHYWI